MTIPAFTTLLGRASIEGGLLVLAVLAVTRVLPRMPAAARCALWWLASLRLLSGLAVLPPLFVTLPTLPHATASVARASIEAVTLHTPVGDAIVPAAIAAARIAPKLPRAPRPGPGLPLAAFAVWLMGMSAAVALHVRDGRRLVRLWREAAPLETPAVHAWLAGWLGVAGARRVELRISDAVASPLLMVMGGAFTPRILVPRACLTQDPARLRMILAHEVSHIQRRDLMWGVLPVVTQCAFWFHPLARWCVNEYAQAREEACDAGALRLSEEAPHRYGELLLAFGVDSGRRVLTAPSYGSSHASQLKRRLYMLAHAFRPSAGQRALAAGALIVFGTLALAPVRLVAAPSRHEQLPRTSRTDLDEPPATPPTEATPATPATAPSPVAQPFAYSGSGRSRASRGSSSFSYSTYRDDDSKDGFTYGYSQGDGVSMSGSFDTSDSGWLEELKSRGIDEYAFFRLERRTYLVTDADDIDRIRAAMRPEMELGRRQGELGAQQGKLGGLQGELGGQQGQLGGEQGRIGYEMARIDASLASGRAGDSRRGELRRRKSDLESRMRELSERMEELGQRQQELGARQEELGKLQSELGRQQQAASRESRARMLQMARELVRAGRAELVKD